MFSSLWHAIIISIILITAGCLGGGGAATQPEDDSSSMATDTVDESLNIVSDLDAVLRDAGSYTAEWSVKATSSDGMDSETTNTALIDFLNERSYLRIGSQAANASGGTEAFHADGVTFRRVGNEQQASFVAVEEPFDQTLYATVRPMVNRANDFSGLDFTGTERYDGVQVKRYVLTDRAPWLMAQQQFDEGFQYSEFEYEIMVDGDGLVRYERWYVVGTQEGVERSVTFEYSLTGVGSTVVEDPDWFAQARAQTDR